jgi:hypothetical protein
LDVEPEPGVRRALSQDVSFVDVVFHETKTDADQRRLVALVRTSAETGYYVDIFRSRRRDGEDRKHEYLYHNLGQSLTLYDDSGEPLNSQPTAELGSAHGDLVGYDYFTEKQAVTHDGDFTGRFRVVLEESPDVDMRVWMGGCPGRTLFAVKAPWARTTRSGSAPPELQNVPMPTLVVRQEGEAWDRPFVAIYEPGEEGSDRSSIRQILSGDCVALAVESGVEEGFADVVLNAIEGDVTHTVENITFKGIFGVIRQREGRVESLYLGAGEHVSCEGCGMESVGGRASAFLARLGDAWTLSATGNMRVWLPVPKGTVELEVVCQVGGKTDVLPGKLENGSVVCEVGPIWDAVLRPRFETR